MQARVLLIVGGVVLLASGVGADLRPGARGAPLPAEVAEQLLLTNNPETYARALHIEGLGERSPGAMVADTPAERWHSKARKRIRAGKLADNPIATTDLTEFRPSTVALQRRPKSLVTAYTAFPFSSAPSTRCLVTRSHSGGRTWSEPMALPGLTPLSLCDNPSLVESSGGRWLYVAYQDIKSGRVDLEAPAGSTSYRVFTDTDVVVQRSWNGGRTWGPPVVALDGDPWSMTFTCSPDCVMTDSDPGFGYGRPALASGRSWHDRGPLYVASTRSAFLDPDAPPTAIAFARSSGRGSEWGLPELLDIGDSGPPQTVVQGPQVGSGGRGEVLVAWFHSGVDGFFNGEFEIRTRRSSDYGRTWAGTVTAAVDGEEASRDLGPLGLYGRWWTTMLPRLAVERGGRAHIVYTHDPEPALESAEEGDIRYITSAGPPYEKWSFPETVNDDGLERAQGFPSIVVRHRGRSSLIDVVWEDTRLSPEVPVPDPPSSSNLYYDIFHSHKTSRRHSRWSANHRISDASSLQNTITTGERTSLAANDYLRYATWADRRDKATVTDEETDIYGSRLSTGCRR
jgi:hypothetical protein